MKSTFHAFLLAALCGAASPSIAADGDKDIVEVAIANGSFKTLAAALEAAGLVDALRGKGPFTVFAPTDAAFAKLPKGTVESLLQPQNKDRLVSLLTYHVVPGRITAAAALTAGKAATLEKSKLEFTMSKGQLFVSGRRVVANDIPASNGVIHVIDEVLIPDSVKNTYRRLSGSDFLRLAVEKGVPLFNKGQQEACATIYEMALRAVLDLNDSLVTGDVREYAKNALQKSSSQEIAHDRAWTLRRAIDTVWRELEAAEGKAEGKADKTDRNPQPAPPQKPEEGKIVFDFGKGEADWFSVNDDVMGGVSKAAFTRDRDGIGVFSGALSLENNGGFATIRSPAADLGLDGYDGLILRVRGDGRRYRFSALRSDRRWATRTWQTAFDTEEGRWIDVKVPFAALDLSVMGRRFRGSKIRGEDIRSLSFSISDKNEDPFRLEIDLIRAYRDAD